MDIEAIKKELKEILSDKRYMHSLGTMKMSKELAAYYGEDEEQAAFAGLIHDIAKELKEIDIFTYVKTHNIKMDEIEKKQLGLMHAKIGASIAKERYNASEEVQNAILYHTTGNKKMDKFAKIIYLADKIEENRNYEGVEELRKLVKKDIDSAILFVLDFTIQKSIRNKRLIHPNTIDLRNYLLEKQLSEK